MHELGIVMHIVDVVQNVMVEEQLTEVQKIVLQVGELSSVIPSFLQKCYPAAVDGTRLEKTELEIETLPANAMCRNCNKVFHLLENHYICPHCQEKNYEVISGKEFNIKELVAF